jgi:hypothetical protein
VKHEIRDSGGSCCSTDGFVASSSSAQPPFSEPRHNLHESESRAHLLAARKVWIEVDDLSDAKPLADCFADHVKTTPLTLVERKDEADVVLRFFASRDAPNAPPNLDQTLFLSMLLLNDEMIWQGTIKPNPRYRGPDPSCQFADDLAAQLRAAMRAARDGTSTEQQQTALAVESVQEELIWNTKDVDDRIIEVNRVFVRHAWRFTVHNGSDAPQVFDGEVQYLDSRGTVIDRSYVSQLEVPAFDERTLTGETLIRTAQSTSIDKISVALRRQK